MGPILFLSPHLANYWSYGVDFDVCIIEHQEQNGTVTFCFKVKSQGHSTNLMLKL